jgi:hypothetical protein
MNIKPSQKEIELEREVRRLSLELRRQDLQIRQLRAVVLKLKRALGGGGGDTNG